MGLHERWRHTLAPATVAVHRRGVPVRSVLPFRSHLFDRQFFGGIRPQKVVSAVGSRLKEIRRGLLTSARDKFLKSHSGLNRVKERTVVVLTDRW